MILVKFRWHRNDGTNEEHPEIHGRIIVQRAPSALSGNIDFGVAVQRLRVVKQRHKRSSTLSNQTSLQPRQRGAHDFEIASFSKSDATISNGRCRQRPLALSLQAKSASSALRRKSPADVRDLGASYGRNCRRCRGIPLRLSPLLRLLFETNSGKGFSHISLGAWRITERTVED